jgi:hypothetical protein
VTWDGVTVNLQRRSDSPIRATIGAAGKQHVECAAPAPRAARIMTAAGLVAAGALKVGGPEGAFVRLSHRPGASGSPPSPRDERVSDIGAMNALFARGGEPVGGLRLPSASLPRPWPRWADARCGGNRC